MKVLVARFIALKQQHLPKTPRVVVSIEWIHLQRCHRQLFPKATTTMATVDSETRRKANLRVLQRIDSNIVDLAITATHVVLYEYSLTKKTWEKKNVEGSLFVTKRSDAPRFKLIVLNRNSTDNLEVPITSTFQMQVRDPYMIIRDSSNGNNQAIRGIWFHDGKERDSVASYLENVVKSLVKIEEMEKAHPPPPSFASVETKQQSSGSSNADAGAALLAALTTGSKSSQTQSTTAGDTNEAKQSTASATSSAAGANQQNLVLDKKNLQLSLLSLIQDERFLDLIHAQYLKVVNSRAARQQKDGK